MFNDADMDEDSINYDVRFYRVRDPALFMKSMFIVAVAMTILYLRSKINYQCA